jgi:flavin reductase (DIM6/NTAB) family NADH-FMN oxidoreductase RutF
MIAASINPGHLTAELIAETEQFSVNFPSTKLVAKTDYAGLVTGKKLDKSALFDTFRGELEHAPMIKACPLVVECQLVQTIALPSNTLHISEVVGVYADEKIVVNGVPDPKKLDPILLTMPDNTYWSLGNPVGKAWSDGKKLKND